MSPQVLPPAAAQGQQPSAVLELLDAFQAVQRERAAAYRLFDSAFRSYLQTKAEGPYRWVRGCARSLLGAGRAFVGEIYTPGVGPRYPPQGCLAAGWSARGV